MAESQAAKDRLLEDFSAVIARSQELLRAMGAAGRKRAKSLRGDLQRKLGDARKKLDDLQDSALDRGRPRCITRQIVAKPVEVLLIGAGWPPGGIPFGAAGERPYHAPNGDHSGRPQVTGRCRVLLAGRVPPLAKTPQPKKLWGVPARGEKFCGGGGKPSH